MTQLTPHFSLEEMTMSQTAARKKLANTPSIREIESLKLLCENVLEKIRERFGVVHISSGYRSPAVNAAVGGAKSSQHLKGEAADLTVSGISVKDLWEAVRTSDIPYDQLILEFGQWVHISLTKTRPNRRQAFVIK